MRDGVDEALVEFEGTAKLAPHLPHRVHELQEDRAALLVVKVVAAVTEPLLEHVPEGAPVLLNEDAEAAHSAVVGVHAQLCQRADLRRAVPPVAAVHQGCAAFVPDGAHNASRAAHAGLHVEQPLGSAQLALKVGNCVVALPTHTSTTVATGTTTSTAAAASQPAQTRNSAAAASAAASWRPGIAHTVDVNRARRIQQGPEALARRAHHVDVLDVKEDQLEVGVVGGDFRALAHRTVAECVLPWPGVEDHPHTRSLEQALVALALAT
mmetsp:Transcript_24194/g.84016  ORF Transcript_24194/g.84016 Transcript_24194/m.84016 type:complete len:267 (-) Transcript_24194:2169-2969(-)